MIATMVEMIIIMTMMPRCPRTTAWACTPSSGTSTPCSARTSTSSSCPSQSSSWWWGTPLRGSSPPIWINYTAILGWGTWWLDDQAFEYKKYVSQIPWNTYVLFLQDLKYRGGYYYAMYGADIVKMFRPKYQVVTQPKYKVRDVWELKFRKDSRRTPCSCVRSQVLWSLWNIWYGTKIFSRIRKYLKYLNRWAPLWVNTTSTGGQCSSSAPLVTSSLT